MAIFLADNVINQLFGIVFKNRYWKYGLKGVLLFALNGEIHQISEIEYIPEDI